MFTWLAELRAAIDSVHPGLFNAALGALLFGGMYLWRRLSPSSFAKLPQALQAWPALALGAVTAALAAPAGGDLAGSVISALGGALQGLLAGLMAVGAHRVLKESPLPYGNPPKAAPASATPTTPPAG